MVVVVAVFIILSHIESVDALRNRFTTFYYPKPFTLYFILDGEEEEERETVQLVALARTRRRAEIPISLPHSIHGV